MISLTRPFLLPRRGSPVTNCAALTLPPDGTSRMLALQSHATLLVVQGRVWLTCEGDPLDRFLQPGESLLISGPARLHLSADGPAPARLTLAAQTAAR